MVTLRPARPEDAAAIRAVLVDAFPTPGEADLVETLRADGDLLIEWVAEADGEIVGAIQYSPLRLERDLGSGGLAAALAPVAVRSDQQNGGIGSRLIRATLDTLADRDLEAVVVLGHPEYYPRFGFSAQIASESLIDPFDAGDAFMALPLKPSGLDGQKARPIYARAFGVDS